MTMDTYSDDYWVAVRRNPDGNEWYDITTISGSHGVARELARQEEVKTPKYYAVNPVIRFANVTLTEKSADPLGEALNSGDGVYRP